ncbi:MAG: hypothetical protein AAFQ42_10375 [Pseudomonadota bacterium]
MRVLLICFLIAFGLPAVFFVGVYFSPWVHARLAAEGYVLPICRGGVPEVRNADTLFCAFRKVELDYDAPEPRSTRRCPDAAIDPTKATAWLRARLVQAERAGETISVWVSDHVRSRNEYRGALFIGDKPLREEILAAKLACPSRAVNWCAPSYEGVCGAG